MRHRGRLLRVDVRHGIPLLVEDGRDPVGTSHPPMVQGPYALAPCRRVTSADSCVPLGSEQPGAAPIRMYLAATVGTHATAGAVAHPLGTGHHTGQASDRQCAVAAPPAIEQRALGGVLQRRDQTLASAGDHATSISVVA